MSVDALLVAIIGPQGSGKTTFINLASGSNLKVGSGLKSCTMEVAPTAPFSINGQEVVLLDTPGFDNTKTSDFDILEEVAQYMTRTYKKGKPLDGILYFHNITDRGVGGIAARNLSLFERLCGDDPLKSVVVVTNMWSLLPREELGDVRERELKEDVDSFGPVLGMGATLMRHKDTIQSSHNIISLLLIARERRRIVAIQTKMLCNLLCLEPVSATSVLTQDIHAKEEEPVQDDGSEASAPEEGTKIKRYDDTQESAKSSIPSLHPVRASKQLTRRFPPPIQIGDYELLMFMGRTTARKTILTNLATRSNLRVGSDMRGYNKEVISTTPFSTDEKELVVIRRSGFDGTGTSDLDIVGGMIQHLAKAYKRNPSDWRLYSYKIADRRAIGIGVCNSRLFEDTCGDDSLDSVVIATNMWQSSPNMGLGVVRQEVAKGPGFFSRVTQRDGALMIHANTRRSTSSILSLLLVEDGREILALQVGIGNDKPWLDQPPTASVITRLSDTRRKKHVEGSWFMVSTVESGIQRHGGTKKSIERTAPLPLPWPHNIRPTRRSSYPTQVQYPQTYRLITDGSLVVPRTLSLKQWDVMERRKVGVFVLSALSSGVSIWRCDDMKGSVKRHVPSSFPAKALTQPAHHSSSPMKMQDTQDRLLIAVLGPTGSGKSAFINLARDSSMEVDFGPKTCTTKVTPTTPFSVNGKEVVLLDTPGFDDTKISASDVLEEIAHYMARVYQRKKLLDGILYFHNIATTGIEKMVVPNLRLLTTLCGDDPLKSVVVVTNMWGLLPNTALGIERQKELVEDPSFVGRIIKGGATLMSHTNTKESSHNILSLSLLEGERRKILALQAKMGNDAPRLDQNPTVSVATRLLDTKRKKRIGGGVCMVTAPENGGRIQTTPNTKEFAERAIPSSLPAQATTGPTHHPRSPRRIQDPEGSYLIAIAGPVKANDSGTLTLDGNGKIQGCNVTKDFAGSTILSSIPRQNTTPPVHRFGSANQTQDTQSYHVVAVVRPTTDTGFNVAAPEGDTKIQIHDDMTESTKSVIPSSIQLNTTTQPISLLSSLIQMGDTQDYHPIVAAEPMKGEDLGTAALKGGKKIDYHDGVKESTEYVALSLPPAQDMTRPTCCSGSPIQMQNTEGYYLIAVVGPTGSGKSSFINLASGSNLEVGNGLKPCTKEVMPTMAFSVKGKQVLLLDTPGFGDGKNEDDEILEEIEQYLVKGNKEKRLFDGILYLQSIEDRRVAKTTHHNLKSLQGLCGDDSFRSVVVVTNMWGLLRDTKDGDERQMELAKDPDFFRQVLRGGGALMRHQDTQESSHHIISFLIEQRATPRKQTIKPIDHRVLLQLRSPVTPKSPRGIISKLRLGGQRMWKERRRLRRRTVKVKGSKVSE